MLAKSTVCVWHPVSVFIRPAPSYKQSFLLQVIISKERNGSNGLRTAECAGRTFLFDHDRLY